RLLADRAMSEDNKIRLGRGMGHLPPCEWLEPSAIPAICGARPTTSDRLRLRRGPYHSSLRGASAALRRPDDREGREIRGIGEDESRSGLVPREFADFVGSRTDGLLTNMRTRHPRSAARQGRGTLPKRAAILRAFRSPRDCGLGHHEQDALVLQKLEVLEGL